MKSLGGRKLSGWAFGLALAATSGLVAPAAASAAAFTNGDLVVERLSPAGTDTVLGSDGATINLDELTTSGTPVQSIALPNFTESGTAGSAGGMTRSADGQWLLIPGYPQAPGSASVSSTGARGVARVNAMGTEDQTTFSDSTYAGNNERSVTSPDGTTLYLGGTATSGTNAGIRVASFVSGGTTTSTQLESGVTNTRDVAIYGNQLFFSDSSGSSYSLASLGTNPTSAGAPYTPSQLSGVPASSSADFYQFYMADLTPQSWNGTGLDTLYVALTTGTNAGEIDKYTYNGTTWSKVGTGVPIPDAYGLTGTVTGANVTLYATYENLGSTVVDGEAAGTSGVVSISDPSAATSSFGTQAPTLLASGPSTTNAYRGIALVPITPTSVGWSGAQVARPASGRGFELKWKDGSGADVVGFTVLRQAPGSRQRVLVTKKMIKGGSLSSRDSYSFTDRAGKAGDKYYVVAHLTNGKTRTYGPFTLKRTQDRVFVSRAIAEATR